MPTNREYNQKHFNRAENQSRTIKLIFNKLIDEIVKLPEVRQIDTSDLRRFQFSEYRGLSKKIDRLLIHFRNALTDFIRQGNARAWIESQKKNDELIRDIAKTISIDPITLTQYKEVNLKALRGFQSRKVGGLRLSGRVWSLTKAHLEEIEMALEFSIGEGRSAQQIARSVKRYLNEPDRLYRRVRDKHGTLRWSKSAMRYKSGRGVYKSSHKNAVRLARTENNMAYRTADHLKYKSLEMVVGISIRLSNTHKHKECEVCETFAGDYPPDFKFTGFHPNCKCFTVPILKTREEMLADLKRKANGQEPSGTSKNLVTKINPAMKEWISKNSDKIGRAKSKPWFMQQNKEFF